VFRVVVVVDGLGRLRHRIVLVHLGTGTRRDDGMS